MRGLPGIESRDYQRGCSEPSPISDGPVSGSRTGARKKLLCFAGDGLGSRVAFAFYEEPIRTLMTA